MHNKLESRLKVGFLVPACCRRWPLFNSIWFTSYVCLFYSAKLRKGPLCYRVPQILSSDFCRSCICWLLPVWRLTKRICFLIPVCTFVFFFFSPPSCQLVFFLQGQNLLVLFHIFLSSFFLGLERVEGDKTLVLSKSQCARCTFELLSPFAN